MTPSPPDPFGLLNHPDDEGHEDDASLAVPLLQPFPNLEAAARSALSLLHQRLGFKLWMVTRTEGNDWIVLHTEDSGYGVEPGQVFQWSDSFCSRMMAGLGPQAAPDASAIDAYNEAPIGKQVLIGAYVGVPIYRADGSFFGTLCAIDPDPQDPTIVNEMDLVHLVARLLATVLEQELITQELARERDRARIDSETDVMTGVYNRRGWLQLLASEDERCRRYGNRVAVIYIDLNDLKHLNDRDGHGAGDRLIQATAQTLISQVRQTDTVARLGGDEFGVLCVETDESAVHQLINRVESAFAYAKIDAALGHAVRKPPESLMETVSRADRAMYEAKRQRKAARRLNQSDDRTALPPD